MLPGDVPQGYEEIAETLHGVLRTTPCERIAYHIRWALFWIARCEPLSNF